MAATRLALDARAALWACVFWQGGSWLLVACGSSATTLGISAGAGGSGSTGGASIGGAGATGMAGAAAGTAGNPPDGGTSSVNGGAGGVSGALNDAAGAGSGGGAAAIACVNDLDCANNGICVFKISDVCSAQASCQVRPPKSPVCSTIYCGCSSGGNPPADVNVNCEVTQGYARAPVKAPKGSLECP